MTAGAGPGACLDRAGLRDAPDPGVPVAGFNGLDGILLRSSPAVPRYPDILEGALLEDPLTPLVPSGRRGFDRESSGSPEALRFNGGCTGRGPLCVDPFVLIEGAVAGRDEISLFSA